jgi:hypothetical protein
VENSAIPTDLFKVSEDPASAPRFPQSAQISTPSVWGDGKMGMLHRCWITVKLSSVIFTVLTFVKKSNYFTALRNGLSGSLEIYLRLPERRHQVGAASISNTGVLT